MFVRIVLVAGLLSGMLAAGVMCAIALDHNPQGEFADPATGAWVTGNLVPLAAIWFGVVFAPFAAVALTGFLIVRIAAMRDGD
ncbi:hypothetical protein ACFQ1E_18845 [Sphingomonas canadensis]|uniref:Uncharacterized protein n=1 Tax=Sphingomonas canadensis TaxID=1219257 RepID=A0ABW3HAC9_9SPHN|nr:hypothetical protein [Sphingomonas canadensis]MCW3838058.1 hypothetical protein [Sphingomonas canadensis]